MSGSGERGDPAPRFAWVFATTFLCLNLPLRAAQAAYWTGAAGAVAAVGVFVLPLLYTVPRGRTVLARHRGWLLAAQAVLTYGPFLVLGREWDIGLSGALGGLALLTLASPWSWLLLGAVVAVEVVRVAVVDLPNAAYAAVVLVGPVNTALAVFGLVRLADLVTELHAARTELAALAVDQERLRAADRLRAAIGDHLETVSARARTSLALLPGSPDQARAQLTEAAGSARQALDQVRTAMAAGRSGADSDVTGQRPAAERAGHTLAPRLARLTLVVVMGSYAVVLLANVQVAGGAVAAVAGGVATIVAMAALQLHHSLARRPGRPPRAWRWTLAAQVLLPFAWSPVYDWNLLALAGFAAGSSLLLLPGRWAWTAFALVVAGVATSWTLPALGVFYGFSDPGIADLGLAGVVYQAAGVAAAGMVIYGLSRLTGLTEQVEEVRRELARTAVERERLRVAQDTHDLLGLGLSAVALKCDLATRLIGRDDARARAELDALLRLAAQARAEIRTVTADQRHLSLRDELAAASEVLASAGVQVHAQMPAAPLPPAIDAVLATVLREATTNILRHATARHCTVRLSTTQDVIRLQVTNDGVRSSDAPDASSTGGAGIGNLRARVQALGGHLAAGPDGEGRFDLTAEIPVTK